MIPLVSINIPTYNNEKTIEKTLNSIKSQTYKRVEVIIIDSESKDKTCDIAKKFGAKIYQYHGKLLGARALGVKKSKGEYILLIDSDQILNRTTIERAVKTVEDKKVDMLFLYERSWKPKTILEKLFDADRELTQKYWKEFSEPTKGVMLPRFFKKEVIEKAFENIPKKILPICGAHDHAIIYIEAAKISNKRDIIPNAVFHIEPAKWKTFIKKTYRWGYTTRDLEKDPFYKDLIKTKKSMRKFKFSSPILSLKSNILRILRATPYGTGYYFGKD